MASDHEHTLIRQLQQVTAKAMALPVGPERTALLADLAALTATLATLGYQA